MRILFWDRTGYCIFSKRLEQGRFTHTSSTAPVSVTMPELVLILEGIDLRGSTRKKRFQLPENIFL